ncbi:hypothetical protein QBC47DRAFT_357328 [Echria macrotheca]|uniref:Uncharacterized protein n=1 Tax=Echria macrotheca TaxID=438768 RepID=A0AAJ0BJM4_9PEZI|nr:hypothetical protein QBC47DRAFT_357328 [Echria macrotheca]
MRSSSALTCLLSACAAVAAAAAHIPAGDAGMKVLGPGQETQTRAALCPPRTEATCCYYLDYSGMEVECIVSRVQPTSHVLLRAKEESTVEPISGKEKLKRREKEGAKDHLLR